MYEFMSQLKLDYTFHVYFIDVIPTKSSRKSTIVVAYTVIRTWWLVPYCGLSPCFPFVFTERRYNYKENGSAEMEGNKRIPSIKHDTIFRSALVRSGAHWRKLRTTFCLSASFSWKQHLHSKKKRRHAI
jgi:hypothetical protein